MPHPPRILSLLVPALLAAAPGLAAPPCREVVADTTTFAAAGSYGVGVRTLRLIDETRPIPANHDFPGAPARALDTEVWYPAAVAAAGPPARDAPIDPSGAPYPLVLFAHALSDHRRGEAYLTEHLAGHGFIVAAVEFPLARLGAPGGATPNDLGNQPGDLRAVLDRLLAGAGGFGDAIDPDRVGASGLSLGAATVLLLAYHRDLRDPRVRAVLPIAPPYACAFTRAFYRGVRLPLLVLQGDADVLVAGDENAGRVFRRARGPRSLVVLRGGSHLGFVGFATAFAPTEIDVFGCSVLLGTIGDDPSLPVLPGGARAGISAAPDVCPRPCLAPVPASVVDAERQHTVTRAVAAAFFAAHLRRDRGARCWLARGASRENPDLRVTTRRR